MVFSLRQQKKVGNKEDNEKADSNGKSDDEKPGTEIQKNLSFYQLFRYADAKDKILIGLGTILSIVSGGIFPIVNILMGNIAGALIQYQNSKQTIVITNSTDTKCFIVSSSDLDSTVLQNIIYYMIFGTTSFISSYLSCYCWSVSGERQIYRISNIQLMKQGIDSTFGMALANTAMATVFVLIGLIYAWKLALILLAILPFVGGCGALMFIMSTSYKEKELKSYESAGQIVQSVLSAIKTVAAFNLQQKFLDMYKINLNEAEYTTSRKGLVFGFFNGAVEGLLIVMFAVGLLYATHLSQTECQTFGYSGIIATLVSVIQSFGALGNALSFLNSLSQAKVAAAGIFEVLEYKSTIDTSDMGNSKKIQNFVGDIEFSNVSFNYPQRPDRIILNKFSLKIPAGKTLAFFGSSGCGKSTVMQLIQRFYDPIDGLVSIDGIDLKDLDLNFIRSQTAIVSQEPILFPLSIRENIRLGRMDATDAEIEEAAKQANAHKFIVALKDKYDTNVGERGSQLSGGQKQKICIARALVRNPKILLLDESTSALDLESEDTIQDALDTAKVGRTTIMIAHRLSTIRTADMIVGMMNGIIIEMGTHEELMNRKRFYYELNMQDMKNTANENVSNMDGNNNSSNTNEMVADIQAIDSLDNDDNDETEDKVESIDLTLPKTDGKAMANEDETFIERFKALLSAEKFIWKFHKADVHLLSLGIVFQMIAGATLVIASIVTIQIIDIFTVFDKVAQSNESYLFSGINFAIAVACIVSTTFCNYCFSTAGAKMTKRVRISLFESTMRQEIGWHDLKENQASLLSTKLGTTSQLCQGLTTDALNVFTKALSSIGTSFIISLVLNAPLAIVLLTFSAIYFVSSIIYAGHNATTTETEGESDSNRGGKLMTQCSDNIKTVMSLGREEFFVRQFEMIFKESHEKKLRSVFYYAFFYATRSAIMFFTMAANFSFGASLVKSGTLTVINLYRIYMSMVIMTDALAKYFAIFPDTKTAADAAKVAKKIIMRIPKIDSLSESGLQPDAIRGDIEFQNVFFRYPTRKNYILKGLNLKVESNKMTALVGQSGCGKSTVIQILLRFYNIDQGKVTVDGIDIQDLNIKWLRSQIGIVSQEPALFNTTILENIQMGSPGPASVILIFHHCESKFLLFILQHIFKIDVGEVIKCAMQANIHNRIISFPLKYETTVGDKGAQLSGGERQRISIARALVRTPKILLLDEATSALDNESEKLVQAALDVAQVGRTCICIAHRLSTIENASKISVFKSGKLFEEGSHDELMKKQQAYFVLQARNMLSRKGSMGAGSMNRKASLNAFLMNARKG